MKLSELKAAVYHIAQVKTTRQLKLQHAEIKPLDMRYKAAWETALALLKQPKNKKTDEQAPDFEDWLSNPPEEYKVLFAEANAALDAYDEKSAKAKRLTKTARAMVASLDEFADAGLKEAQELANIAQRAEDISKQADLN